MNTLDSLFENEVSTITENNFLTPEQISSFLAALDKEPKWKEAEIPEILEHLWAGKAKAKQLFSSQYMVVASNMTEGQYLELSKNYFEIWKKITTICGFDPYNLFIHYLKRQYQIDIHLANRSGSSYCPIVVRDLSDPVLPHADYGPYDGKNWAIEAVEKQIAWNVYLTHPGEGGETTIYDYFWKDNDILDENSYGIENFNQPIKTRFSVSPGKLVLFNSRNFHAVAPSSAPRIAIGGLLGKTKTGQYWAWA